MGMRPEPGRKGPPTATTASGVGSPAKRWGPSSTLRRPPLRAPARPLGRTIDEPLDHRSHRPASADGGPAAPVRRPANAAAAMDLRNRNGGARRHLRGAYRLPGRGSARLSPRQLACAVRHRVGAGPLERFDAHPHRRRSPCLPRWRHERLGCRGARGQALFPCPVPVPAHGVERRLPHGRSLQSVRLLRSAVDRLLRAPHPRPRAGVHYVVINLTGSALFLVGVALLYGVAGTLNMADLARSVGRLEGEAAVLAEVAGLILLIVFGVKAALFPLYFWLPTAYTAAAAPVAALFALMTKVGVYAILRVFPLIFGDQGTEGGVAAPWLLPAGLITLGLGTLGALAATDFGRLTAYLTLASVGTLLAAVGLFTPQAVASALFYLVHSTLVTAALFLLWERVAAERGFAGDRFQRGPRLGRPLLLSGTYAFLAAAAVGLPPFSGFLGKVMILESARGTGATLAVWSVVLATGLLALFAVTRAGSRLFWDLSRESPPGSQAASLAQAAPILSLAAALAGLVALASPFRTFTDRAAQELFDVERYAATVLRHPALPQRGLPNLPSEEAPR
ncbi:MAG: hypothetical protein DI596_05965 [Azospira oryzae]|nr:MAG: hypothetical protein DI596_05965 [Azospira oryzae]PZP80637.1 MAG: hypothetical protein DI593_05965 [Azospira oryzae]